MSVIVKCGGGGKSSGLYVWKKYDKPPQGTVHLTQITDGTTPMTVQLSSDVVDLSTITAKSLVGLTLRVTLPTTSSGIVTNSLPITSETTHTYAGNTYGISYDTTNYQLKFTDLGWPMGTWDDIILSNTQTFLGCVVSDNESAYPDGGLQGGYWYQKIYSTTIDGVEIAEPLALTFTGTETGSLAKLPVAFYGGYATVFRGEIHFISDNNRTALYKWDGTAWTQVSTLPYNWSYSINCIYNNKLQMMGTNTNTTDWRKHYEYDGENWTEVSILPYAGYNYNACAVEYKGKLHRIGNGLTSNNPKQHYEWDGVAWTQLNDLPYDFIRGIALADDDYIHIMRGGSSEADRQKHYKYDGSNWASVSTLPYDPSYAASIIMHKNKIHLLGGESSTVYQKHYSFNGDSWDDEGDLPEPMIFGGAVSYKGRIRRLGGKKSSYDSGQNHHEVYGVRKFTEDYNG